MSSAKCNVASLQGSLPSSARLQSVAHNCTDGMAAEQVCKANCAAGYKSVGFFTCVPSSFVGNSACLLESDPSSSGSVPKLVTKLKGAARAQVAYQEQNMKDFKMKEALKAGMASALGVYKTHISKFELAAVSRRLQDMRFLSHITIAQQSFDISYEVVVPFDSSAKEIEAKAATLAAGTTSESAVGRYFQNALNARGVEMMEMYPVAPPVRFTDEEMFSTSTNALVPKGRWMTKRTVHPIASASHDDDGLGSGIIVESVLVAVFVVLLVLGLFIYKRRSRQANRKEVEDVKEPEVVLGAVVPEPVLEAQQMETGTASQKNGDESLQIATSTASTCAPAESAALEEQLTE